jgi:hypothetical protein
LIPASLLRGSCNVRFRRALNCGRVAQLEALEGPMVREIELFAVSLVFVFLGACAFGFVH